MAVNKLDISMMEDVGTSASQLVQRDGSGNLPAVDGSQLINVDTGFTQSTSDPTVSTNPSGGVGAVWYNKTSGEAYICTDATAGENVWTNVGAGTGDVQPWAFQGTAYGYMAGGNPTHNVIQKYSFSTDGNATDVGDLTTARAYPCGSTAVTHGYSGGENTSPSSIDKWSYSTDGNSTSIGNLAQAHGRVATASNESYGFWCAGGTPSPNTTMISKSTWASDGNSVDSGGDISQILLAVGGHSSGTYGYCSGGERPSDGAMINEIQKYSFSISSGTTTDVGDLTIIRRDQDCQSSTDYGYAGASGGPGPANRIDRFAFASDANATDWGTLGITVQHPSGTSSTTNGYCAGSGHSPYLNHIQKISFASAGTSADIGDLTNSTGYAGTTGSNY